MLPRAHYLLSLLGFLLLSGILSLYFGKDLNWDLTNYHFYNPYALLHHRYNIDYWPANITTFLNPTIDFVLYFMINYFPPIITGFIMGAIHGLNFWLFFLIVLNFIPTPIQTQKYFIALIITLVGMYSPHVLAQIGKSFNDLLVSIFVFAAIFYSIKLIRLYASKQIVSMKTIALIGLLLGLGTGLKYTVAVYLVAACLSFLFFPFPEWKNKIRYVSVLSLFSLIGITITAGYWMLFLFHQYHSPLYPFFAKIFHAGIPMDKIMFQDWRHKINFPQSFWRAIFFPFFFSWTGAASDFPFIDFRFVIVYCLFIWLAFALILQKNKFSLEEKWLLLFFIFSYIIWEYVFSALRYIVALEIFSPLIIYILIRHLINKMHLKLYVIAALYGFILLTMYYKINWVIGSWFNPSFFGVKVPNKLLEINNSLALIPTVKLDYPRDAPQSLAYLIPFFPENWHFVGIPYANNNINYFPEDRKNRILKHSGPIVLIATKNVMPAFIKMAKTIGLVQTDRCTIIQSECEAILKDLVIGCPMKKSTT